MSEIIHTESDRAGRYALALDGHEAELTYVRPSPNLIVIEHTIVPKALGGRGLGKRLVKRAVEDAIEAGDRVGSTCWFATALIEKFPAWKAVSA